MDVAPDLADKNLVMAEALLSDHYNQLLKSVLIKYVVSCIHSVLFLSQSAGRVVT